MKNKRNMILSYELVFADKKFLGGIADGVFSIIIERRDNIHETRIKLSFVGLDGTTDQTIKWVRSPLQIGDEIQIKALKVKESELSKPIKTEPVEHPTEEQELKTFQMLKKRLEEAGMI
jgi:hypothetical protein